MKSFIIRILFIVLLLLSANIVKSQPNNCPPGFNYVSFTAYWGPNLEPVTISFCYACTIGPAGVNILNVSITTSGQPTENFNDAFDATFHFTAEFSGWLQQQMLNKYFEFCSIPPCVEGSWSYKETVIRFLSCWKLHNYPTWYDSNGGAHHPITYEQCSPEEAGYCLIKIKYCRDYNNGGLLTEVGKECYNYNFCPEELDVNQYDWNVEFISDCYQMHKCCP